MITNPSDVTNSPWELKIDSFGSPEVANLLNANKAYVEAMSDLMLKQVGICLNHISKPSDFQFVADFIHQHFAIHFEAFSILSNSDLPRFLDPDLTVKIEPEAFTQKLASLELPEPNEDCPIIRNLVWLTDLFNLTFTERKVLLWSYCTWNTYGRSLDCALVHIEVDKNYAYESLAVLLDESFAEIEKCYVTPNKLASLMLSGCNVWQCDLLMLGHYLSGSEFLADLLEQPHKSKDDLLNCFNKSPLLWHPPALPEDVMKLSAWYESPMASAMRATALSQPLNARHIATFIASFTGHSFSQKLLSPLAGHIDYLALLTAVKQAAIHCCRARQPLTEFAVLKALYSAAS